MRKELQEIEIIEHYLMGKLTAQENEHFEKKMNSDKALKERVALQQSLVEGLERIGLKAELVKVKRQLWLKKVAIQLVVIGLLCTGSYLGYDYLTNASISSIENTKEEIKLDTNFIQEEVILTVSNDSINEDNKDSTALNGNRFDSANKTIPITKVVEPNSVRLPVKEAQTFLINPSIDNTITGKEGTIIGIPANSFDTNLDGLVEIKLKEFYELSDMVFANLSTETTEGGLLETGGMIYLEANQGEKKKLTLKTGKPIELKYPVRKDKINGMKLFTGNLNRENSIVWKPANKNEESELPREQPMGVIYSMGAKFTHFVYSDEDPGVYLDKIFRFPTIDSDKVKGKINIGVKIDNRGQVVESSILRGMEFPPQLYSYVKRAARSLPALLPAKRGNRLVNFTTYTFELSLVKRNDKRMLSAEAVELYYDSLEKDHQKERIPDLQDLNQRYQLLGESIEDRILSEETLREDDLEHYVMLSMNMGWLNCDRDLQDNRPKLTFKVKENNQNIQISLISHTYRSIIRRSKYKNGEYHFYNIPKGERLSCLAIKNSGISREFSYDELLNDGSLNSLNFVTLTEDSLKSMTQKMNKIGD